MQEVLRSLLPRSPHTLLTVGYPDRFLRFRFRFSFLLRDAPEMMTTTITIREVAKLEFRVAVLLILFSAGLVFQSLLRFILQMKLELGVTVIFPILGLFLYSLLLKIIEGHKGGQPVRHRLISQQSMLTRIIQVAGSITVQALRGLEMLQGLNTNYRLRLLQYDRILMFRILLQQQLLLQE